MQSTWCSSPISMVQQRKLVSGRGLKKRRSSSHYGPIWLEKNFTLKKLHYWRKVTYSCWDWKVTVLLWRVSSQVWSEQHQTTALDADCMPPAWCYCLLKCHQEPSAQDDWTGRSEHSDWSPTESSSGSNWVPIDSAAADDQLWNA